MSPSTLPIKRAHAHTLIRSTRCRNGQDNVIIINAFVHRPPRFGRDNWLNAVKLLPVDICLYYDRRPRPRFKLLYHRVRVIRAHIILPLLIRCDYWRPVARRTNETEGTRATRVLSPDPSTRPRHRVDRRRSSRPLRRFYFFVFSATYYF